MYFEELVELERLDKQKADGVAGARLVTRSSAASLHGVDAIQHNESATHALMGELRDSRIKVTGFMSGWNGVEQR